MSIFITLLAAELATYSHSASNCVSPLKHYESVEAVHDQLDTQKVETRCMKIAFLSAMRGKEIIFQFLFKFGNGTVSESFEFSPVSQSASFISFTLFDGVSRIIIASFSRLPCMLK